MNLLLSDDQRLIREAAESFLADASDSAAVRAVIASDSGFDATLWQRLAGELGWSALSISESHGGMGLGPVELALLQEQAGRRLLCAPFFSTVCLSASLLQELADEKTQAQYLPEIAAGSLRLSAPLSSSASFHYGEDSTLCAAQQDQRWQLSGQIGALPDAGSAQAFVLPARTGDGALAWFLLRADAKGLQIEAAPNWDGTRRCARLQLAAVPARRIDDPPRARSGAARALALARLYLAAEALGGSQQCLDLTLAYISERKQFGRTIASFQAIKHRCAGMMVKIEALRSLVAGAAALAAEGGDGDALLAECAAAKAQAAETYFHCAQEAIQLHGGVGFTWEYDPQLHFKRAQALNAWLGYPEALRETVMNVVGAGLPATAGAAQASLAGKPVAARADEAFRHEVAGWMHEHLQGRFAALRHRGGPGDEEADPALRKAWERELASGGWTCVGWPREHGGRGLSIAQQVIFHEEYARAGGPGRMGHIGEGLLGPTLIAYGTPEQQRRFLPQVVAGREFWAQGYSEPNAGSDLANVQTRAEPQRDGSWRVSGQKIWTSLAHESDWIFVLARSEPGSRGNKGLSFLLLPLRQSGIEIRPIRQLGGGSEFNEVFFDGARAEAGHLVGKPGEGWKVAMGLLDIERGVSTLGQQMHFLHEFEQVCTAARRSGRIAEPAIRARLAQAWSGLRVMRYNALRMLADGAELGLRREALIYKYYWSNWHRELGKLAMDVLGEDAAVISTDELSAALQKLFFFSRADTIYGGSNEIQLNLIAERGLGMPREPRGS
ncbi:Acyl-CoA dehydrogenase [Solimonas aquatica]|uniref:Acyl-CoA dehydrogenase n=1 Tax=Solimonas aquatica TaxID=489703 RepID=A0A1H9JHF9_9GAMM|nr:acyl-CoA dehydrogenase [Solimonas aquatica]SEQ86431.1 Acyl-CoA dehydrogenase [Solimonas aquatica]